MSPRVWGVKRRRFASEARAAFLTSTFTYYRSGRSFAAALTGGIVGGLLWHTTGTAFALFVAGSTRYAAIYSTLAVLILFLIWVYVSWLVLLFGAAVACYRQYPEYILPQSGEPRMRNRMRE
jgi:membrane protein